MSERGGILELANVDTASHLGIVKSNRVLLFAGECAVLEYGDESCVLL